METLFKRFGIPTPENFEDYNLIGIDFGDGELSASFVELEQNKKNSSGDYEIDESNDGRISVLQLSLAPSGTLYKNVNAFYHSPTTTELIYDVSNTRLDAGLSGFRYYNYKKCPGDITADSLFQTDDKTTGNMSYRQVMVEGFSCVVNTLFENNLRISRKKPTIILVGRPSSAGWESSELEYARMLRNGLKLPEGQKEVYIAIEPESTAALASEMDPKYEKKRINQKEIVVILDNGSSTFDITVVGPNGVVGEDSYQFGGNQLDENLLALLRYSVATHSPGAELESEHGHKLALRILKEGYYGVNGAGKMTQLYQPDLKNVGEDQEFEFRVDKKTMKKALEEMPARAFRFETGLNGMPRKTAPVTYKSWIGACEAIYSSFYDKMKEYFTKQGDGQHPVVPDRIILSGGVSIMPEVQETVKRVFGVEPTISPHPNYSVSQGLAYILGTEVRKKQLLDELLQTLTRDLPKADTVLNAICEAGEEIEWNTFDRTMKAWAMGDSSRSVRDLRDVWHTEFNPELQERYKRGAKLWYDSQQIEGKINSILKKSFEKLFPDYVKYFSYQLPPIDFNKKHGIAVIIQLNLEFFTGLDEPDIPRDVQVRHQCYRHFLSIKEKILKGGSIFITHSRSGIIGAIFGDQNIEVKYPGVRSYYEKGITMEVAEETRDIILEALTEPLTDFVESITPYFNMTAQQSIDSKV